MAFTHCGAEIKALMKVSDDDVTLIEDKLSERLAMGEPRAQAQRHAVADAIAMLAEERAALMDAIFKKIGAPKKSVAVESIAKKFPEIKDYAYDFDRGEIKNIKSGVALDERETKRLGARAVFTNTITQKDSGEAGRALLGGINTWARGTLDETYVKALYNVAEQKPTAKTEYTPTNGTEPASAKQQTLADELADRINRGAGKERSVPTVLHAVNARSGSDPALYRTTKAVESFAKKIFGINVVWVDFEGKTLFRGAMSDSIAGTIFLDIKSDKPHMAVLLHEMVHEMRKSAPDIYARYAERLNQVLNPSALNKYSEQLIAKYEAQGLKPPSNIDEELHGDIAADFGHDPEFWKLMGDNQPAAFRKVLDSIKTFLDDVLAKLTGANRPFGTDKYLTDIKAARQAVATAMREFSGTQVGAMTNENVNDDVMFSISKIVGENKRKHSPEQIRAMENVGFKVEVPTFKERQKALWKDFGTKMAQGIADQFAPIKALDGKAYGLLRLSKGASGAFESFLHGGKLKLTDGVYDFDEQNKGGVIDSLLIPLQGEHHDFMRWIAANRAERLMTVGKENLFTKQDIADLKTLADGVTDFEFTLKNGVNTGKTTRDRTLIYADSLKTFNSFNKNILDMSEESGLIDGDSRVLWENEFYVPFYRTADDADGGVRGMNIKSGMVRQSAFQTLKGGKNELKADLLDNVLLNWSHLLDASAKNRAAKATIEAAEAAGVATMGNQSALAQMGASIKNKSGVVWFLEGGQKRYSLIDQTDGPYILNAITALEYAGMKNPVMNAMGTMKHVLTVGVTASPYFKIRNLIRDSLQAIGTSNLSYNPAKNIVQGWKLTDPKSDAYFRLLAGGGTIHFGTMLEGSEAKRVQSLVEMGIEDDTILNSQNKIKAFYRKAIEPSVTAYNELGNRGEAINRASLYDQLIKQGVSHAEASLQARDLMDFSMQGTFTSIRFLTQVVPFFNARIQGMYKLGKSAKENPMRFGIVLGATAAVSLSLLAAYHDDDDWKKREDWDRNNFWWFKFGGKAFRIPKPFEIGAIATLAERGFEVAFDKEMTGKRFREQVMTLLGDNLSMNPVPQLVKPIMDVYANKDSFTGRQIETPSMEKLKSKYRFTDRTSMTARAISTGMNAVTDMIDKESLSPVQVDHMLRGYFGWLGSFIVGAADIVARPASDQPKRASSDMWKLATGNMVSNLEDAPSRYVSQMYTQAKEIEQAYGTFKMLEKQGKREEADKFVEDNREKIRKHEMISDLKSRESKFNEQIRITERSSMSPDEKRDRIRVLNKEKDRVARAAN